MAIIRANFGFYSAMAQGLSSTNIIGTSSTQNYIEIYSGAMPADADDWFSGYPGSPTQLLATFNDFRIEDDVSIDMQNVVFKSDSPPNPGTVNASATGTAAWYAMYDIGQVATWGAILGDVSVSGPAGGSPPGGASMHLDSLNLVQGQPVQLLHWGIRVQA